MKSTKTKLNVQLLRRVKRHILAEPRRLRMEGLATKDSSVPCGTAACIAGWTLILSGKTPFCLSTSPDAKDDAYTAEELLGLERGEGSSLFWTFNWPVQFRVAYRNANKTEAARIAADRIEHFVTTGE